MDLEGILNDKLNTGDKVVFHEGVLLQSWSPKTKRFIALVERNSSFGVFIFTSSKTPPRAFTDLTTNFVLPIDNDFKCDVDTISDRTENDICITLSSKDIKIFVGMQSGDVTSQFFNEISRAMNYYLINHQSLDFFWLKKYHFSDIDLEFGVLMNLNGEKNHINSKITANMVMVDNEVLLSSSTHTPNSRESVVQHQMLLNEKHYTYEEIFRIFIGTWNVNGQSATISLNDWLVSDPESPDIYAIGFQELDLSKEAFLFNDSPREDEWLHAVTKSLEVSGNYKKVSLVRLVGMMLIVFVKKKHMDHIKNVATDSVGTGIMGKLGNKGGVAVRMDFHNTSFCFINSHLAAHVEEYERRNQDYHNICSRMVFSNFTPPKSIKDHNQVFWFGDLNYRITEMSANSVKEMVNKNNLKTILEFDQFKQQHRIGNVFKGYKEGPINFVPTYKYDPGTNEWDSSDKNRTPAWCDRILWLGNSIKLLNYRSHPNLLISDHKPVSALFESKVKVVDSVKYRKIHEDIMKKLDKVENEFLPQVMVDNTEIIFDNVHFMEPQNKQLTVANTGQVPVQFEFIRKLDDSTYCKEWLQIEPFMSFIDPGEKCDVSLEVLVDKRSAYKMNSGQDQLYDILVLHLEGGKDIFITVTGSYERSCFGCSLETLCYLKVPIREIPPGKLVELENNKSNLALDPYPVPKEIWYLVDHLYRHGLKQQHLFEQCGLRSEFIQIRNWLDTGSSEVMPGSVHSVAETLLILLDSTSEPIIPFNLHSACLSAVSNYNQCKQIISQLPERSKNVFLYLCAFLQELLNHVNDNDLDVKTIASVFGEIFIRDPPRSRLDKSGQFRNAMSRKKTSFLYHFLVNDQSDLIIGIACHTV
ncbi:inositol polyphosphate 5-phosphatase OCRL isoform X2 [Daktulosphaira vitifoliae]|uniref:inositol polyphosphate 5-phosphatase OCRL isoform X2 n=1 Tax=Daktulosphaira vitifoliae TaxID=58002 RepID=UPI0021A9B524|nr:inositol polyphosphate 5-phosphatase OCRL isoform X2 [Daktulosphaira vitifoliae]